MHLILYCISIFQLSYEAIFQLKAKRKLKYSYILAWQIYLFLLKMTITASGVLFNLLQEIWKHLHWEQKQCRIYQWKFRIKYLKSQKRVIFKIFERKCKNMENQKERKKIYIMDKGFFSNLYQISWKESLR